MPATRPPTGRCGGGCCPCRPTAGGCGPAGRRPGGRRLVAAVPGPVGRAGLDGRYLAVEAGDDEAGLDLLTVLRLHPSGVLEAGHTLRNLGCALPGVAARGHPAPAGQGGRAARPDRALVPRAHPPAAPAAPGRLGARGRHGRTGHDATLVLAAGTPGFGFRSGEVWGLHLGWSGDAVHWAERNPDGHAGLGAAELLGPTEVALGPGQA